MTHLKIALSIGGQKVENEEIKRNKKAKKSNEKIT